MLLTAIINQSVMLHPLPPDTLHWVTAQESQRDYACSLSHAFLTAALVQAALPAASAKWAQTPPRQRGRLPQPRHTNINDWAKAPAVAAVDNI